MTLANKITMGRLAASVGLFVLLAFTNSHDPKTSMLLAGALLFIAVAATDALDGYFARKYGEVSEFGRIADPAVDKITVAGSLIFLCAMPWAWTVLKPWMVVVIVGREFLITGLRGFIEAKGIDFSADRSGKLKMIVQCCAIPGVFVQRIVLQEWPQQTMFVDGFRWLTIVLVWASIVLTVTSGAEYIRKAARQLRVA